MDLNHLLEENNDNSWIERAENRLGEKGLLKMMNDIYNFLLKIQPGKCFNIEENVKPENHEVFIQTCCEFISIYPNYRFNRTCTIIHHDLPFQKK